MRPVPRILRRLARPAAELTAAGIGLLCCMATSDAPDPQPDVPDESESVGESSGGDDPASVLPDVSADVILHNGAEIDLVVRVRALLPGVDLDCDAIAAAPGELLLEDLFAPAETWTMPPSTNVALVDHYPGERGCWAARIESDRFPTKIAFWFDGDPAQGWWPGEGLPESDGVVQIVDETAGIRLDDRGQQLLHEPVAIPPQQESCAPADDGSRIAWSTPVPTGIVTLEAFEVGLDGCLSLSLVADAPEQPPPWYVCVSGESFPFEAGDAIEIQNLYDTGVEGVRIRDAEGSGRELVVARGSSAPAVLDFSFTLEPRDACDLGPEPTCGTVSQAAELRVASLEFGAGVVRGGGEALELFAADGRRVRIDSAVVQQRAAVDPECAFGPDVLGPDLELAVTIDPESAG